MTASGDAVYASTFTYDPVGNRLSQVHTDSAIVSVYVHGPGIGPLAAIRPGGARYLHADGLGSTRVLTDEEGVMTDRYAYTAFGELYQREGSDPATADKLKEARDGKTSS